MDEVTLYVEKLQQDEAGTWVWVTTPVVLNPEADFSMDDAAVDAEICRQGKLMVKYGEIAAELGAEMKRKEEELKLVRAQVAGVIRSQAEAAGTKMTEGKIEEQVVVDPRYQGSLAQLHILRASSVKADHYWRSIVKKADLLNALAFMKSAEIKKSGY